MTDLDMAKTIYEKRKEKGLTQTELADFVGVSKSSVSKWETGKSYPDITFLPVLASCFNITVDELINYQPQISKAEIRKLYKKYSKDFAEKPVEQVMNQVDKTIKKYYSCFDLVFQMASLKVNHYSLVPDNKKQLYIQQTMGLFQRVKNDSNDISLCKMANFMEAYCYMILSKPDKIIELLKDKNVNLCDESNLLAMGYSLNNQMEKAKETIQIGIYNNMLNLIQNLITLLQFNSGDKKAAHMIFSRITAITQAFEIESFHPAIMFSVYLTSAQVFAAQNDYNQALILLDKYCNLATSDIYPIKLQGDTFFNMIENFLDELDLGTDVPRDTKTIKQSIVMSIVENPVFVPICDNAKFKAIVKKLKTNLGG